MTTLHLVDQPVGQLWVFPQSAIFACAPWRKTVSARSRWLTCGDMPLKNGLVGMAATIRLRQARSPVARAIQWTRCIRALRSETETFRPVGREMALQERVETATVWAASPIFSPFKSLAKKGFAQSRSPYYLYSLSVAAHQFRMVGIYKIDQTSLELSKLDKREASHLLFFKSRGR